MYTFLLNKINFFHISSPSFSLTLPFTDYIPKCKGGDKSPRTDEPVPHELEPEVGQSSILLLDDVIDVLESTVIAMQQALGALLCVVHILLGNTNREDC